MMRLYKVSLDFVWTLGDRGGPFGAIKGRRWWAALRKLSPELEVSACCELAAADECVGRAVVTISL